VKALLEKFLRLLRPIDYAPYELAIMRVLFALVIWKVASSSPSFPEQPDPIGLAAWFGIDFTFFAEPAFLRLARPVLAVCLAIYCIGRLHFVTLPVALFFVVGAGTLSNSQGAATHSTQIVALCLLTQCAWHLYAALTKPGDANTTPRARRLTEGRLAVWFTLQTVAAAYIVSAFSKWLARGNWIRDASDFPLQVVKSQRMDYYNSLQAPESKGSGYGIISDALAPAAAWMEHTLMTHPAWAPALLAPGFFLELFAFVLLAGRKIGAAFAILLIVFHLTIAQMMGLDFKFNIYLLAIFALGIPFWLTRGGLGLMTLGKRLRKT